LQSLKQIINLLRMCFKTQKGVLAEWLGNGLQNHVQRFESARHLKKTLIERSRFFYEKKAPNNSFFKEAILFKHLESKGVFSRENYSFLVE
jgi:hypothetical protein